MPKWLEDDRALTKRDYRVLPEVWDYPRGSYLALKRAHVYIEELERSFDDFLTAWATSRADETLYAACRDLLDREEPPEVKE